MPFTQIQNVRFNHVVEHYEYMLDNGETLLIPKQDLEKNLLHMSIEGTLYSPVFEAKPIEFADDILNITGFRREVIF